MKISLFLISLFVVFNANSFEYIVKLKDKKNADYPVYSERALARRVKNNAPLTEKDKKVSPDYLSELSKIGTVITTSRWLNTVVLNSDLDIATIQNKFDFIEDITLVNSKPVDQHKLDFSFSKSINYGSAYEQNTQIGVDCLHDQGYTGTGVYLAILDAGFMGMDTISYFNTLYDESRIIDVHNFVSPSTIYGSSEHGTAVASCIAAEKPGVMVGTSFDVMLALYITEDVASETPVEEYNLVAGLERCDINGVDVASISLGYTSFDNPSDDHNYSDMDGNTTVAAQGVNAAVNAGIVVLAAAGNEGPSFISTPCDADSCLCIAAVDNMGNYAFFSSVGPSADGQVKPDVAARGQDTWVVIGDGSLVQSNGTSFATPITSGATACLIQAHPNKTAMEIITAIRESGSQFSTPDEYIGYGISDFCTAKTTLSLNEIQNENWEVYPNPAISKIALTGVMSNTQVKIYSQLGEIVLISENVKNEVDVSSLSSGVYLLKVNRSIKKLIIE